MNNHQVTNSVSIKQNSINSIKRKVNIISEMISNIRNEINTINFSDVNTIELEINENKTIKLFLNNILIDDYNNIINFFKKLYLLENLELISIKDYSDDINIIKKIFNNINNNIKELKLFLIVSNNIDDLDIYFRYINNIQSISLINKKNNIVKNFNKIDGINNLEYLVLTNILLTNEKISFLPFFIYETKLKILRIYNESPDTYLSIDFNLIDFSDFWENMTLLSINEQDFEKIDDTFRMKVNIKNSKKSNQINKLKISSSNLHKRRRIKGSIHGGKLNKKKLIKKTPKKVKKTPKKKSIKKMKKTPKKVKKTPKKKSIKKVVKKTPKKKSTKKVVKKNSKKKSTKKL